VDAGGRDGLHREQRRSGSVELRVISDTLVGLASDFFNTAEKWAARVSIPAPWD